MTRAERIGRVVGGYAAAVVAATAFKAKSD